MKLLGRGIGYLDPFLSNVENIGLLVFGSCFLCQHRSVEVRSYIGSSGKKRVQAYEIAQIRAKHPKTLNPKP